MSDLPPAKMDRRFHLIALVKQPRGVIFFEFVVVFIRARPKLYFLDCNEGLLRLGFLLLLFLFVLILTEVNDSANRRLSLRRDLDEIESALARDLDRLLRWHYAKLISVLVDDADFPNSDPFVDSDRRPAISSVPETSSRLKAANTFLLNL
jgi:hypothetical protein